jgi:hypothetical protein
MVPPFARAETWEHEDAGQEAAMETKYLIEDLDPQPPMRRPVPVVDKRQARAKRSPATATPGPATDPRPRGLEDLPWRAGYRLRRFVMTIWGPPQLDDAHDPLVRLSRERAARYAARTYRAEAGA